jgi:hypothetical protein
MFRSSSVRIAAITVAVLVTLGLLRYKPWQRAASSTGGAVSSTAGSGGARPQLAVGFLPVT